MFVAIIITLYRNVSRHCLGGGGEAFPGKVYTPHEVKPIMDFVVDVRVH